ncbi:dTDP-glucose 4,6-dehydratase [Fulvivirgaceae bacterium BMA10]|uniref:dTDP-glucose 4,6-dehydratase n=1 Tax=Splendidivirga corallicola TaxID=3051826 RepID=A0ABT8KIG1_9BACT|nr:dTDP-glucose 4,6-dehydratase [Fulvivirgaceae bacterium BMA10]
MEKNILVTGGAGFIGSNFISYFLNEYDDCKIINLDKLTYAGSLENLEDVSGRANHEFIKGDICDRKLIEELFQRFEPSAVIHFAAESHVDNSIEDPECFIRTNINGTFNLLDVAKVHWMTAPFEFKKGCENNRFLHISTDEVYGSLGQTGYFTEETPFAPNSPYSASKASSDLIVRSFYKTYGMNVVTTNCSNNYGPGQHFEKLIPTIIRKALAREEIPIYGDGKNIRDWLYVTDHCKGIDTAFQIGVAGETYNIGGNCEKSNIYIATLICNILDGLYPMESGKSYRNLIAFVKDRPGHDRRYAIDSSKIERELGWRAEQKFENALIKTVKWYVDKFREQTIPAE